MYPLDSITNKILDLKKQKTTKAKQSIIVMLNITTTSNALPQALRRSSVGTCLGAAPLHYININYINKQIHKHKQTV